MTGDSPRSLKKITLFNWSGFAFLGTRTHKKQLEQRQELSGTGLYFLFSDPIDGIVRMYIGESDNFLERIKIPYIKQRVVESFYCFSGKC